jgi:RimJ/RimL family protein N-acetyltransferase
MQLDIGEWQIRSWRPQDQESLVKYANNRKVWINLGDTFPHPYTEKDAKAWLNFARTQEPEVNFAVASDQQAIGGIGLHLQGDVHRRSAGIGYWLGSLSGVRVSPPSRYALSLNTLLPTLT